MVLPQTVIVSSASISVLALATGVAVYFYGSYARPEAVHPAIVEEEISRREMTIQSVMKSMKNKFPDNLNTNTEKIKLLSKELEAEKKLGDHEIKILFKDILTSASKAKITQVNDIEQIKPIKFDHLDMPKPAEIVIPNSFKRSEEVFKGQVGLSLATETFFSAVYRIQNLFGKPGLVGHFFLMSPKQDWKTRIQLDQLPVNFSAKDRFMSAFSSPNLNEFSFHKYSIIVINSNDHLVDSDKFEEATRPEIEEDGKVLINPYKWLHLSVKLSKYFSMSYKAIYVLVFPKDQQENHEEITYPKDVSVFEFDWMKTADATLHSGCIKRIENHCRDFLPNEKIDL